ncbi:MAG: histidinol-phosphate transaminase [Piccolia ochrophora]|nr:MAG: histidinol-phosphate transaminase [Piccolia ochrophora]
MAQARSAFDLQTCARPNILSLQPYRCARDEYKDNGTNILLDANENAYGPGLTLDSKGRLENPKSPPGAVNGFHETTVEVDPNLDLRGLNRYPDPHQEDLKSLLCEMRTTNKAKDRNLSPSNLFLGVGSDEAIDALIRCFCTPGASSILTCPPTYGMYSVSAVVNDVRVVHVPLQLPSFVPDTQKISDALTADPSIKLIYLCSPGNPTGTLIPPSALSSILSHPTWNGVLVVDEAYIDFAPPGSSFAEWVLDHPNLVVMQTLSKAFGLAGIRVGAAFTSPPIAHLLNNLKAPYNISAPSAALAISALSAQNLAVTHQHISSLQSQRERLLTQLPTIPGIGSFRGGVDANFLLVEILDRPRPQGGKPSNETALALYRGLAEQRGVVVRFRGKEYGCEGCLRVTVGTAEEVDRLLREVTSTLEQIYAGAEKPVGGEAERQERKANAVVA